MLSVADAQKCVLDQLRPLPPVTRGLQWDSFGLVLAEDIVSDIDMPPFAKAMMDGYAVRVQDLPNGRGELSVVEEITAGKVPQRTIGSGQAARIMTGAPLPEGADAVIMIERSHDLAADRVRLDERSLKPGLNIMPRGKEMRRGDVVLKSGARLRPQEVGVLASVGRHEFLAYPPPRVAIVPTGDELVEHTATPGPGQIRNSNAWMLEAQVRRATGGIVRSVSNRIARDNLDSTRAEIQRGLQADVLILSGGVSAGKLDLVPQVLAEEGVLALFHKVSMKPGKPVLFGIKARQNEAGPPRFVFGLPGNPVSSMVCFELFVAPALRGLMALPPGPRMLQATLAADYAYRTDRPTYHPARLRSSGTGWTVEAVPWHGSPDLRSVSQANGFVVLPEGDHQHRAGQVFPVLWVEESD